ncbi:hypothetical protein [Ignicoccus hospitalis]|uniref:Thioredoxin-like fold domain-containing protein n=1 Tax=Ignicoccus hospitalis (strain KIN4/I / DSM 18386 / JCM 14125) TaxID=453591 RepID=A8ABX4_IGNH4|nr:hypothetical protein [Ignicoccus hospitalis]ABU82426.1 hypothetical protein Igni_1250 [Ignicoccus hospitalis KIN4/I]HIH90901.1 hypothetical protein [Desulfurococcaceae archaeon]
MKELEFLFQLLGLKKITELEGEVVVEAFPLEEASPLKEVRGVKVIEGKEPEDPSKKPYLRACKDGVCKVTFYGSLKGVLIPGFLEVLKELSKGTGEESLPHPVKLKLYVYPGLPCYKALKEAAPLIRKYTNLELEVIHVDSEKRLKELRSLGANAVPAYAVGRELLHVGPLSASELENMIKRLALDLAIEKAKEELLKERGFTSRAS